jgi:peptidoglycan hydrolase-like protein with peptidoglycan-binding domain
MRSNTVAKALVSVTAVVGLAAGSLAGASGAFATTHTAKPAAVTQPVQILDTVNLGLSTAQAKGVQHWLAQYYQYTDTIDGQLGTHSWQAMQRFLKAHHGYTGNIDGIVGGGTVSALQRFLRDNGWGYTGKIDGIAGSGTQAAFATFANWCVSVYGS